ncbi:hypothetical protein HMPREF0776_2172 [Staphylococcus aureus subsp. aureus USA300_TCH959]|nr:hypothetical protein HMPREF0776_2172 [Staphylococcus aureus subsp. aureus USA300_TCH959]
MFLLLYFRGLCGGRFGDASYYITEIQNKRFFIFYGGKVKLPAFFNTQKAQLPL